MKPTSSETIPEKFKDAKTGAIDIQKLANSYKELEKKLSSKPSLPKSPQEYCVTCEHGMFDTDDELNRQFFEKGFTNEQVQFVYNVAAKKLAPLAVELAADFEAEMEIEKLMQHFGGMQKWQEMSRQLLAFGQKKLPRDVLENLASSYEGIMTLHKMMQNQEPSISKEGMQSGNKPERDLFKMMRDPKYWRERDPSFVQEVTQKFREFYGNE